MYYVWEGVISPDICVFLNFCGTSKQLADKNQWKPCMDKIFYESRAGAGDILALA